MARPAIRYSCKTEMEIDRYLRHNLWRIKAKREYVKKVRIGIYGCEEERYIARQMSFRFYYRRRRLAAGKPEFAPLPKTIDEKRADWRKRSRERYLKNPKKHAEIQRRAYEKRLGRQVREKLSSPEEKQVARWLSYFLRPKRILSQEQRDRKNAKKRQNYAYVRGPRLSHEERERKEYYRRLHVEWGNNYILAKKIRLLADSLIKKQKDSATNY